MGSNEHQTRDSVEDIWGTRTPYKHEWPTRVDERSIEEAEKWVQSACVLCRFVLSILGHHLFRGLTVLKVMDVEWI